MYVYISGWRLLMRAHCLLVLIFIMNCINFDRHTGCIICNTLIRYRINWKRKYNIFYDLFVLAFGSAINAWILCALHLKWMNERTNERTAVTIAFIQFQRIDPKVRLFLWITTVNWSELDRSSMFEKKKNSICMFRSKWFHGKKIISVVKQ